MREPTESVADEVLFERAADLQVQLERGTGTRPILWMLREARKKAVVAMAALVQADAADTATIRTLQNEVIVFDDIVRLCRETLQRGKDADRRIAERDREILNDIVMFDEDAKALGLEPHGID